MCVKSKLPTVQDIIEELLATTCPDCDERIIPAGTNPFPPGTNPIEFRKTKVDATVNLSICQSCGSRKPFVANLQLHESESYTQKCWVCGLLVYPEWEPAEHEAHGTIHRYCYQTTRDGFSPRTRRCT